MITVVSAFTIIAGIIIIGYMAETIFKKTRIPDVIFLMAIGLLFTQGLGWFVPKSFGFIETLFATFALVFLLFQGSINLDFKTLFASLKGALSLTILSFIFTVGVTTIISTFLLQIDLGLALLLGFTIGGTSSSIVIPLVRNLGLSKKNTSILTVESAISDVLCIIGSVTVIAVLTTGQLSGAHIISSIIGSFIISIFIGVVASLLWIFILTKYKEFAELEMLTIAIVIALFALVESAYINASGVMAVLSFGLVLGNSKPLLKLIFSNTKEKEKNNEIALRNVLSSTAKNFYSEISFFVKVFFFVYLGMLINFNEPIMLLWGAIITLAIYIIRPIVVRIVFRKDRMDDLNRTSLEVLIPKGIAAAVIVQLAIQRGVPGAESLATPVMAVIFISIILTAILIFMNGKNAFNGFINFKKAKSSKKEPSE